MDLHSLTRSFRYPLITLSTRAQVESKRADSGFLDAVKRIIDREGFSGLFAGLDSALFGITVTNFVYYYCTKIMNVTMGLRRMANKGIRVRMDQSDSRACCHQGRPNDIQADYR